MEPSPYSGDEFEEVVVAMGEDCSVKSDKVLDKFTAQPLWMKKRTIGHHWPLEHLKETFSHARNRSTI
jgi:hypothetical protein